MTSENRPRHDIQDRKGSACAGNELFEIAFSAVMLLGGIGLWAFSITQVGAGWHALWVAGVALGSGIVWLEVSFWVRRRSRQKSPP